jgi:O-antigen ligase
VFRLSIATTLPSAGVIVAALAGTVLVVGALSLLMRRRPDAFPLLAVFALPFRLPISTDGRTVNLLIPLYLVVAAGTLAHLLPRLLGRGVALDESGTHRPPAAPADKGGVLDKGVSPGKLSTLLSPRGARAWLSPSGLEWLLLGAVVLYALQGVYSTDHAKAAENIAFFYVPFGLLFMLLRDVRWTRELVLACLGVAVVLAVVFAGIGFVEYYRKSLFLNPKVLAANQFGNYFRVNSLFFDPSIYGRFLAIVMIALTTVVLWSRRRRDVLIVAGVLTWLLAGLITSFSQSSIAALLLGLALLAAYRWDARATLYVTGALLAIAAVFVLLAPPSLHFGLNGSGGSTSNATSGRTKLVTGGLELFAQRPLYGYGSGSFETEYKRHGKASEANATSASHTIPITVAAEQGIVGLLVYFALLTAAFVVLLTGAGRSPPRPKPGDARHRPGPGDTRLRLASPVRPASPFRLAIAACFAALVLHTWTYADFLEDPLTWTLLGIGVALARQEDRWPTRPTVFER